jgi:hypothetical protein
VNKPNPAFAGAGGLLLALSIATACLGLARSESEQARRRAPLATISLATEPLGRLIPPDFDGFSVEVDDAAKKYLGPAGSPNSVFLQLIRNLGQGTIRIGGDSSDYSCYDPNGTPHPGACRFNITTTDIQGFLNASAATGWGLILGINLEQNDPSWARVYGEEAVRLARKTPGARLLGFEFGNEPDLYSTETHAPGRPAGYSWQGVVKDWQGYIRAFKSDALTSRVSLVGPAFDAASSRWRDDDLGPFIDGVGAQNLRLVTVHEYPTSTCDGNTATIPELLSPSLVRAYARHARGWIATAGSRGLELELGETNSSSCGGQRGVDDVFASTLWGLDWLFTNAQLGFRRINFHMDNAAYSAVCVKAQRERSGIVYRNSISPLYYAMYAFTRAVGKHLLPTRVNSSANLAAYAVSACSTCEATVFVINKDLQASGEVVVAPSRRMGQASMLILKAPGLGSRTVTYGGQSFDARTGKSRRPEAVSIGPDANGGYWFNLPKATAIVLMISPR